jgi:hypothetical protein
VPQPRRSLKDAARDPLTTKPRSAQSSAPAIGPAPRDKMPVLLKVAIGLVVGFSVGFVTGHFNRWL